MRKKFAILRTHQQPGQSGQRFIVKASKSLTFGLMDSAAAGGCEVALDFGGIVPADTIFLNVGFEDIAGRSESCCQLGRPSSRRRQRVWMKSVGVMPASGSPDRPSFSSGGGDSRGQPGRRDALAAERPPPTSMEVRAFKTTHPMD
jgi:hypothetical protein